jgi:ATP-dependent Lon protease
VTNNEMREPEKRAQSAGDVSQRSGASGSEERPLPPLSDDAVLLLPMRARPLFPDVVMPVAIGREPSIRAVQYAVQGRRPLGLVLQKDPEAEEPGLEGLHSVGTMADIVRYITGTGNEHHVILQGRQRFRIREVLFQDPCYIARVEMIPEPDEEELQDTEVQARFALLKDQARKTLELLPEVPEGLSSIIDQSTSAAALTNMVAALMELPPAEKQKLLEIVPLRERMSRVLEAMTHQTEVLRLYRDIGQQTRQGLEQSQREHYLREQMRTIRKELGEDEPGAELAQIAEAISAAGMPPEVEKEARKELGRLEAMPQHAAEYSMLRTYLEWLVDLPWSRVSESRIDIAKARAVLDEDHYGLEKVKRRILEFLAVRKLNPEGKSPILCLVGPPGVGKTSLGKSIARATGREFVRVSLGGVNDESEIRGHRRTYVGALPGNVIRGIAKARTRDPVFMLDEIDKLGNSFRGDPASALLEVLDPAQNAEFRDHYLNLPFDLSRVMFIATANQLDTIPGPLRDRCEIIEVSGYTEEEKLQIAQRYLVSRQLADNGITAEQLQVSESALREIIRHYTREAGCRSLEREIGAVCRNVATQIAEGATQAVKIDVADVHAILGRPRYESEVALRTSLPGVATGLAWTPVGGDLLFIEATRMDGKGQLILTGQLGDVMQESARTALSLVKANAESLGIDGSVFERSDIHVHVPAGATPKDGPSAGVSLFTAVVSLLTGRRVRSEIAMTGEISLRGLVLPVGGIKEKLLAAHRSGIRTVLLPARNEKDLEDLPEAVRRQLRIVLVESVGAVLQEALEE